MEKTEGDRKNIKGLGRLSNCVGKIVPILAPLTPGQRDAVLRACLQLNNLDLPNSWLNRQIQQQ
jgi:hypothetical protein